jgi:hypothetical protein
MDNYENNNNSEYSNNSTADPNQPREYDTVGESKKKIIIFVVFVAIMIIGKLLMGE